MTPPKLSDAQSQYTPIIYLPKALPIAELSDVRTHGQSERICGLTGGYGAGKTIHLLFTWLIPRMLRYPLARHVICGRDLRALKRGALNSCRAVLSELNIAYEYNSSDGRITLLKIGAELISLSAENFPSFRSLSAQSILCEEVIDWATDAFAVLASRLRPGPETMALYPDLHPEMRFSSNLPFSTSNIWFKWLEKDRRWKYWSLSTRDNAILLEQDPHYIETLESTLGTEARIKCLVDGLWQNVTDGFVYPKYDPVLNCQKPPPGLRIHENMTDLTCKDRLCVSCDFNVGQMSWVIFTVHNQSYFVDPPSMSPFYLKTREERRHLLCPDFQPTVFYVREAFVRRDASSGDIAQAFCESSWADIARRNGITLYGDASGGARSQHMSAQSSARSNWELILQTLRAAGIRDIRFKVPAANPSRQDRYNYVNLMLRDKDNRIGILFDEAFCERLLLDLTSMTWRPFKRSITGELYGGVADEIQLNDAWTGHCADCLGYAVTLEHFLRAHKPINWQQLRDGSAGAIAIAAARERRISL